MSLVFILIGWKFYYIFTYYILYNIRCLTIVSLFSYIQVKFIAQIFYPSNVNINHSLIIFTEANNDNIWLMLHYAVKFDIIQMLNLPVTYIIYIHKNITIFSTQIKYHYSSTIHLHHFDEYKSIFLKIKIIFHNL